MVVLDGVTVSSMRISVGARRDCASGSPPRSRGRRSGRRHPGAGWISRRRQRRSEHRRCSDAACGPGERVEPSRQRGNRIARGPTDATSLMLRARPRWMRRSGDRAGIERSGQSLDRSGRLRCSLRGARPWSEPTVLATTTSACARAEPWSAPSPPPGRMRAQRRSTGSGDGHRVCRLAGARCAAGGAPDPAGTSGSSAMGARRRGGGGRSTRRPRLVPTRASE